MELHVEGEERLTQLSESITKLSSCEYNQKIEFLSNATIGQHTRHIIELFLQLFSGYEASLIDYDNRKREIRLQKNIGYAVKTIEIIISKLRKENKELMVMCCQHETVIKSNFERELLFNIEHCIHHQAIIKIGFLHLNKMELNDDYGVAKSTIANSNKCVR